MRKQILFLITLLFALSINIQAQDKSAEKEMANTIMNAILQDDISMLETYQPTTDLLKSLYPEMAGSLTDKELKAKFLEPLAQRLQGNIDNIQAEIKKEKIDLKKIKFKEYSIEKMHDDDKMPFAMSIQFYYGKEEEAIPVTVLEVEGKWYIFEILISTNIFK